MFTSNIHYMMTYKYNPKIRSWDNPKILENKIPIDKE